jgi:hypothetical protein
MPVAQPVEEGAGLGLLRDPAVEVLRRGDAMVAVTPEIRAFLEGPEHRRDLAAQERHFLGPARIGAAGEQADEAQLARQAALGPRDLPARRPVPDRARPAPALRARHRVARRPAAGDDVESRERTLGIVGRDGREATAQALGQVGADPGSLRDALSESRGGDARGLAAVYADAFPAGYREM